MVPIGFIEHDLWRTMAVYPFVSFGWPGYLVKPRFAIENGEPRLLNSPLSTPDNILNAGRIHQLPFVEYDLGYRSEDWYWRFDHGPLVLRLLTSAFPRWPPADPRVSEEATKELNARLLAQFVKEVAEDGAAPIVTALSSSMSALVRDTLARARVTPLYATPCLSAIPADRWRVPSGQHYSGPANRAIAQCTAPAVQLGLRRARSGSPPGKPRP